VSVVVLAAILCLAHGVFELTFDKRAGVLYLREMVSIAVVAAGVWVILRNPRLLRLRIVAFSLLYVVAFIGLSALFAWLWFRQPPFFGVLEERRMFGVFWLFVLIGVMGRLRPGLTTVVRAYFVAGIVLGVYSCLYYFGVIPENSISGLFIEQHFYAVDDPRNATRYVLSASLPAVVIPLALASWSEFRTFRDRALLLCALGIGIFTVVFINQTRTLMATILLIAALVLMQRSGRRAWPVAVLSLLLLAVVAVLVLFTSDNEKVRWMIDSMVDGQQVRRNTASIILAELESSWYWGRGALSVQFNRGFLAIYNDNFWLNDVGKLGLLYRFGFLTAVFLAFYFYVARYLWRVASTYQVTFAQVAFWVYLLLLVNPMANVTGIGAVELGILTGWLINHESDAPGPAVSPVDGRAGGFRVESGAHAAHA
jgi:hypothetical protein